MEKRELKREHLWLWGQDPGTHHANLDEEGNGWWRLPGENKMTPMEGAKFFGIPNMCRIAMGGKPEPPFEGEMDKLKECDKVAWSIIGDSGSKRNYGGSSDLDEVLSLASKYAKIVGGVMDDFFVESRRSTYTPEVIKSYANKLHESNLDLWCVVYENDLKTDLSPWLKQCDIVSFWTWGGHRLKDMNENLALLNEMVGEKQKIYAGCYMWDYGNRGPLSNELMLYQLDMYKKWFEEGKIHGIILCSNCIADIGLETVEITKKWFEENIKS